MPISEPISEKFTSPSDAIDEMMSISITESKNEPMDFSPKFVFSKIYFFESLFHR
jgi:hypothetical protein